MKLREIFFGKKATELTYEQVAALIDNAAYGKIAGVVVNHKTALQVSTVLACVKVIADGCATPDLNIYRQLPDRKSEIADDIPEHELISRRPNEFQTSFEFRRMMTVHAALAGAALAIKVRGDNRKLRELIPIAPGNWSVRKVSRYEYRYRVWDEFGMIGEFNHEDVFLLNGLQWEVGIPLEVIKLARSAIGLTMATEKTHVDLHENGIQPSGLYSVKGELDGEQYTALKAHLKSKVNTGDPLIIDRDGTWTPLKINGVDAQHIETRRLQIEEVCRAFGVFPIMVMHSDKSATFASSEAFFSAHLKHTLTPWHRAWSGRLDETLLDGGGPLYTAFDTRYLTEGSIVDRAQYLRSMVETGIYTRNDAREHEGKDPLPGLDEPLTPLNMSKDQGQAE